jgi:23S rRNA (uridine2552-2'-O)-methyltransferase
VSKSSNSWLKEHFKDPFVKQSWTDGYRSRAAYKLIEIQKKYRFLKPGMNGVDLGAAPGSWCQVAQQFLGKKGILIALDLLPIEPLPNLTCLQGDFTSEETFTALNAALSGAPIHFILSDMAQNMSGNKTADQAQSMVLLELAYDFALQTLEQGGHFVTKVFQGRDLDALIKQAKQDFTQVHFCKPEASRDRSSEHYLVCLGIKSLLNLRTPSQRV